MPTFSPFLLYIKKRYKTYILQKSHKKIIQKQWENSTHTQLSNKGKISESTTGDKAMRASTRQIGEGFIWITMPPSGPLEEGKDVFVRSESPRRMPELDASCYSRA